MAHMHSQTGRWEGGVCGCVAWHGAAYLGTCTRGPGAHDTPGARDETRLGSGGAVGAWHGVAYLGSYTRGPGTRWCRPRCPWTRACDCPGGPPLPSQSPSASHGTPAHPQQGTPTAAHTHSSTHPQQHTPTAAHTHSSKRHRRKHTGWEHDYSTVLVGTSSSAQPKVHPCLLRYAPPRGPQGQESPVPFC